MIGLVLHVLHEHQVPDLDESVLVAEGRTAPFPVLLTLVVEDLRARPTRARHPHLPEVVLGVPALDPIHRDDRGPDVGRLVIGLEHREPETLRVHAQPLGRELVRPRDCLFLEVVAEAEVPQHLEEGEVTKGGADDVDVDGPHHLLDRGGPGEWRLLLAEEVGLEGDHPGIGEQQRRIVRDQRGRGADDMALFLEERGEGGPYLVAVHGGRPLRVGEVNDGRPVAGRHWDEPPWRRGREGRRRWRWRRHAIRSGSAADGGPAP